MRKICSCRTSIEPSPIQMKPILSIYWTDSPIRITLWSGFCFNSLRRRGKFRICPHFESKRTVNHNKIYPAKWLLLDRRKRFLKHTTRELKVDMEGKAE